MVAFCLRSHVFYTVLAEHERYPLQCEGCKTFPRVLQDQWASSASYKIYQILFFQLSPLQMKKSPGFLFSLSQYHKAHTLFILAFFCVDINSHIPAFDCKLLLTQRSITLQAEVLPLAVCFQQCPW